MLKTCSCATAYTLGLEEFIESAGGQISFVVLIVVVCCLLFVVLIGQFHATGLDSLGGISIGIKSDYFELFGCMAFIIQIWDFFSDLLLCFDIFDHYNQASINNPKKDDYFAYLIASSIFIFVPWIVNLIFLMKTKRAWETQSAQLNKSTTQ